MATDRTAYVTWHGSLLEGSGTIDSVGSGAFGPLDVTWASRAEQPEGRTSPEELIAAAHAACFSMALSHGLANAGAPPEELSTSATVTFQPGEGITRVALKVRGRIPGIDADGFREQAEAARTGCPVSQALAGVPEITVAAELIS
jgi:osmotically inducible protein OsmC